jgi:hypothetical protein
MDFQQNIPQVIYTTKHPQATSNQLKHSQHKGQFFNFNLFSKLFLKITTQKYYLQI